MPTIVQSRLITAESEKDDPMERLLITVNQAADKIGLGRTTMYQLIRRGDLRSVKIGGARRVAITDLEQFVIRLRDEAAGDST